MNDRELRQLEATVEEPARRARRLAAAVGGLRELEASQRRDRLKRLVKDAKRLAAAAEESAAEFRRVGRLPEDEDDEDDEEEDG